MKITLIGMENYLNSNNTSLFDGILLPESTLLEKEVLTNTILLECGEFEALYADTSFMQFATKNFFLKHNRTFTKWVEALMLEYNPIENYDRKEEESYDGNAEEREFTAGKRVMSNVEGKVNETYVEGKITTNTTSPAKSTTTHNFAGFRPVGNTSLTTGEESINQIGNSETANVNQTVEGNNDAPSTFLREGDESKPTITETGHEEGQHDTEVLRRGIRHLRTHGNIGVTTSQQMLESELELAKFNLYHDIMQMYKRELTLAIYI